MDVSRFPICINFKRIYFQTDFYKKAILSTKSERVAFHLMEGRKAALFTALYGVAILPIENQIHFCVGYHFGTYPIDPS